jgi:hypothetical protein
MTVRREKVETLLIRNRAEYFLCLFSAYGQYIIPG